MSLSQLLSDCVLYDGSIDCSYNGYIQYIFVSSDAESAENIYRELTTDDIYEAFNEIKEGYDGALDDAEVIGCSICLYVYDSYIESFISIDVENESEAENCGEIEIKLDAQLADILLEKVNND